MGFYGTRLRWRVLALFSMFLIVSVALVVAVSLPEGPSTLEIKSNTKRTVAPADDLDAVAGNVTHLLVDGKTITQSWQGYVGNITGTITLDDASNFALYDWSVSDPEGEIYATYLNTVDWTTGRVYCWNWSNADDGDGETLVLGELEGTDTSAIPSQTKALGVTADDVDGVNETFSYPGASAHSTFYVGGQKINGVTADQAANVNQTCPLVSLYNGSKTGAFEEVLLFSNHSTFNNRGVIYTSIINPNTNGYNNETWDFEMIVGENGHNGDIATTKYYFYVELE